MADRLKMAVRRDDVDKRNAAWRELQALIEPSLLGPIEAGIARTEDEELQLDFVRVISEQDLDCISDIEIAVVGESTLVAFYRNCEVGPCTAGNGRVDADGVVRRIRLGDPVARYVGECR